MILSERYPSALYLLNLYGLDESKLQAIRKFSLGVADEVVGIVDEFYNWLATTHDYQVYFRDQETLFFVKKHQKAYWQEFLTAIVDEGYVKRRRDVGRSHARIGLPIQTYFSSLTFFLTALTRPILRKAVVDNDDLVTLKAITSLVQLDAGLAIDAIFRHHAITFNQMAQGDYSLRYQPRSDDDLFGIAFNNMAKTLLEVESVCEKIADGHIDVQLPVKSDRDSLAKSINYLIAQYREITELAKRIAEGDYGIDFVPRGGHDLLGSALRTMTVSLRRFTAERETELERARFFAELADALRHVGDTQTFYNILLSHLCRTFSMAVGRVYSVEQDSVIYRGGYADSAQGQRKHRYMLGEGLVGQVALDFQPIVLEDVPADYIDISSGLGSKAPRFLLLYPLRYRHDVVLVLEFAAFSPIKAQYLDFLAQSEERIASAFVSVKAKDQVAELLVASQEQAKNLAEVNTVLEEQTQALMLSEKQMRDQQADLEETNRVLEERTRVLEEQRRALLDVQAELEEKTRELSVTSQFKSEFVANMSHELRTPLNGILLLAELLLENKNENLSAEQLESLRVVNKSGQDLLELINDILDLSKSEAGHMDVVPGIVRVGELLKSLYDQTKPLAQHKNLTFTIESSFPENHVIETDARKVKQVLRNLLSNACKFTHKGTVSLTARPLTESVDNVYHATVGEDGIAFVVADTGIGISPDKQEIIFEAFQQADGTTSRRYGGTGLGLSICREYIRLLGGAIHLSSDPGQGSIFTVYLPSRVSARAVAQEPLAGVERVSRPPARIDEKTYVDDLQNATKRERLLLVVEDDEIFGKTLCHLAREQGFQCIATRDADYAYTVVSKLAPEAIVLDIVLSGSDGWSVFDRIKDTPWLRHIPIQFVSAHHDLYNAMQKGAIGFLQKPVGTAEIQRMFRRFSYFNDRETARLLAVGNNPASLGALLDVITNSTIHISRAPLSEMVATLATENFDCVLIDVDDNVSELLRVLDNVAAKSDAAPPPMVVYGKHSLSNDVHAKLMRYSGLVIKETFDTDHVLDDLTLFLHTVIADLPPRHKKIITDMHLRNDCLTDKKVLLVDDDMRNIFAVGKLLKSKNMEILVAENGISALELLQRHADIDIVLMDLMMPEMDGYETIRRIRRNESDSRLPIIALTAKSMPEDRHKALLAGANDYLAKPVDANRLLMTMRVWLQQAMEKTV